LDLKNLDSYHDDLTENYKECFMAKKKSLIGIFLILALLMGCATSPPLRPVLREDFKVPAGTIERNQFSGIRYPFKISVPPNWKMSTEFPDFLSELGYYKPSIEEKEQTELYIFNPVTKSNIQIDLTPANPYSEFSQQLQESRVTRLTSSLVEELHQDYGKDLPVDEGPTEAISLKGVQYAAKKYVTYTVQGVKREQGWIYGFTEPYQIFILYMILGREGVNDRQDMSKILDSFEVISK
jgi:hypothetical protein